LYLFQAPEKMADAPLLKGRVEDHLERRREVRGDAKIPPGLVVEVVTLEGLRVRTGEWGEWERGLETTDVKQCKTVVKPYIVISSYWRVEDM
jgi:hypothetical protein